MNFWNVFIGFISSCILFSIIYIELSWKEKKISENVENVLRILGATAFVLLNVAMGILFLLLSYLFGSKIYFPVMSCVYLIGLWFLTGVLNKAVEYKCTLKTKDKMVCNFAAGLTQIAVMANWYYKTNEECYLKLMFVAIGYLLSTYISISDVYESKYVFDILLLAVKKVKERPCYVIVGSFLGIIIAVIIGCNTAVMKKIADATVDVSIGFLIGIILMMMVCSLLNKFKKCNTDKKQKNKMRNKKIEYNMEAYDVNGTVITIFLLIEMTIVVWGDKITLIKHSCNICSDVFMAILTISFISISVMSIIANNVNDNLLNMSVKRLFFKQFIYKFNYVTLFGIAMMINMFAFFNYMMSSQIGLILNFVAVYAVILRMIQLTYYMVSKKSKIYARIIDIINKKAFCCEQKRWEYVVNKIYKNVIQLIDNFECNKNEEQFYKEKNEYILEEIRILFCLKKLNDINNIIKGYDEENINKVLFVLFEQDSRDNETIKNFIAEWGEVSENYKEIKEWVDGVI